MGLYGNFGVRSFCYKVVSLHNEVNLRQSCKVISLHHEVDLLGKTFFVSLHTRVNSVHNKS